MTSTNLTNSKYEDMELVSRLVSLETQIKKEFESWDSERYENYNLVTGKLFTSSELAKLKAEGRPVFNFNSLKPIITQIAGAYKNNLVSIEALPRTDNDLEGAKLMTSVLQYIMHTKNDSDYEFSKSFLDAVIGRIGWIATEWVQKNNEMFVEMKRYDPFRLKFDPNTKSRDLSDCRFIIDSGWYGLDELLSIFALEDIELWSEIEDKANYLFGGTDKKKTLATTWLERITGQVNTYIKDNKNMEVNITEINSTDFYNNKGLFKVIETHERKAERIITLYDSISGSNFDITKRVMKDSKIDNDLLQMVKSQFTDPIISQSVQHKVWVSTVIPALNIKAYEAPYPIEESGFNYKFTPVYCYDYHPDTMEIKSVVDDLKDGARAYTKHLNTMQEALARSINSTILFEEDALGEYEEAFKKNTIGGLKKVPQGTISQNKIKEFSTNPNLNSFQNMSAQMLEYIKFNSGVRDNAMGTRENANESGKVFNQRVAQTEIMQEWINENSQAQIMQVCSKLVMYAQKYMTNEQIIRITDADTGKNENLPINVNTIQGVMNDVTVGEYDIILAKAPYGKTAKDLEFQKLMELVDLLAKVNPELITQLLPVIVKASGTSYVQSILEVLGQSQQQQQEPQQDPMQQLQLQIEQLRLQSAQMQGQVDMQKGQIDLQKANVDLQKAEVGLQKETISLQKEAVSIKESLRNIYNGTNSQRTN